MSFQGKYEIVKLLLKHGADATKKNRDGHTPLDLVKVTSLQKGFSELFFNNTFRYFTSKGWEYYYLLGIEPLMTVNVPGNNP